MSARKGILAVDDTLAALKLLTDILTQEGYAVRPASSGEQALASVFTELPELILLDVKMPGMDGFEVCRRLKADPAAREIPVLFLSASTDLEERVKGFELGATDFIAKPFQRDELLARVRTHLELSRFRTHLETLVEERTEELKKANEKLQAELGERLKAEERIRLALGEKEVLIRELYHRTKNNMQVICSMMKLHSLYSGDHKINRVFQEMENRIYAMALVHQKLYQSRNLSSIYFCDYIDDLCELLKNSYSVSDGRIAFKLDVARAEVLIDIAVPCGLIINELISNSLKYAFPGETAGEITIRLERGENGAVKIVYGDNGPGLPSGFDFEKDSRFGMKTIFSIVRHQLQGTVDFERGNGICCRIEFQDKYYARRV
ncbi:MAG TPA: response regulator [Candidatus Wallbacteria bacterium]|nr:MAG: Response regulator PleD [bacterium ADurb.Bin243]HOD39033.1 response regulator [Candidatus Wallbacteria bacterium]HPG56665.1 response regulator [Candidatus Wallbacteria bacterium]